MKTIAECVTEIITTSPYLEEALSRDLINLSSLARQMKDSIAEMLNKKIQTGAIVMALKRFLPQLKKKINRDIPNIIKQLGEITVRSHLCDYTYRNSDTVMDQTVHLIDLINERKDSFFALSQGIYETMFIVSAIYDDDVERIFRDEDRMLKTNELAAITIKMPPENIRTAGLYYFMLKQIAWEGITIKQIVSTTHEFTLIMNDEFVDQTFSIIKHMRAK